MAATLFFISDDGSIKRTDLPPITEAEQARDEAMDRVELNADELWKKAAYITVCELARTRKYITTDDVWRVLSIMGITTHEQRAMGPIMRKASRLGIVGQTGRYVRSERKECHARPVMVWESLSHTSR